jgi:hypothetical protein
MKINKWDFKKHKYSIEDIPKDWNVPLYSNDMDIIVNCPNCGKEIEYGDGYTSKQWQNHIGLGYSVCEECHNKEIKLYKRYKEY